MPEGERERPRVDIHLCGSCKEMFTTGDEVVALSDGHVTLNERLDVSNRRLYHLDCWIDERSVQPATDGDGRGDRDA